MNTVEERAETMDRVEYDQVEGEIGLVIDYQAGVAKAVDVLNGALSLITALEHLDSALLSSIDTKLEPVSILNDVQHSSFKLLLARVVSSTGSVVRPLLNSIEDDDLQALNWKAWIGKLLVKGKHALLKKLDADAPQIELILKELEPIYKQAPLLLGYDPPKTSAVKEALGDVKKACLLLGNERIVFQSELGDIELRASSTVIEPVEPVIREIKNKVREILKVRYPDMLGNAQWTVNRGGKQVRVAILHDKFLEDFQNRRTQLLPGDSLDCKFDEYIRYDGSGNELDRKIEIIEVLGVITPPKQGNLTL